MTLFVLLMTEDKPETPSSPSCNQSSYLQPVSSKRPIPRKTSLGKKNDDFHSTRTTCLLASVPRVASMLCKKSRTYERDPNILFM